MTKAERTIAFTEEIAKEIIAEKNAEIAALEAKVAELESVERSSGEIRRAQDEALAALEAQLAQRDERIGTFRYWVENLTPCTRSCLVRHKADCAVTAAREFLAADAKEGEGENEVAIS